jgi:transcription elongation GreA/GreB family factor
MLAAVAEPVRSLPTVAELAALFARERGCPAVPPLLARLVEHVGAASPMGGVALLQLDAWLDLERRRGTPPAVATTVLVLFLDWCWERGWLGRCLSAAFAEELAEARIGRRRSVLAARGPGPDPESGSQVPWRPPADAGERERELARLEAAEAAAVADLERARQEGDLRENAAYQAARERLAWLRTERAGLEGSTAPHAGSGPPEAGVVTDPARAGRFDRVALLPLEPSGAVFERTLVAAGLGALTRGHLALDAPLGRALHGAAVGEERAVLVDGVAVRYRVQALWKAVLDPAAEEAAAADERALLSMRLDSGIAD